MESLLCDEVWLMMSPDDFVRETNENVVVNRTISFYSTTEDREETFRMFMHKERSFMPEQGYLNFLDSNNVILNARFKAVNWLVKTHRRMNLSTGTVFGAVNYLDRYISTTRCQRWKNGMFELLSIACLSVASKLNETTTPPLHEFQVEEVDHSIAPNLIQKMELMLMNTLGWRMDCVTPFSYVQLLIQSIDFNKKHLVEHDFASRVTELLLNAVSDAKVLEFRPCVIATAVVRCILKDLCSSIDSSSIQCFSDIVDHKDDIIKCQMIMDELLLARSGPSSPVTVLKVEQYSFCDSGRKRKREELENWFTSK